MQDGVEVRSRQKEQTCERSALKEGCGKRMTKTDTPIIPAPPVTRIRPVGLARPNMSLRIASRRFGTSRCCQLCPVNLNLPASRRVRGPRTRAGQQMPRGASAALTAA